MKEQQDYVLEKATLGAGCFWCVEAAFEQLKGVEYVQSGYSGGDVINPTYQQVCTGETGHAEVVQITYNPNIISFEEILEVFWTIHDPTSLNRQGDDIGTQYRSVIFYHNEAQRLIAEEYIKQLEDDNAFDRPIVTEVTELNNFYPAEDYHKNYFRQNEDQPYCRMVIRPKINKFKKQFKDKLIEN